MARSFLDACYPSGFVPGYDGYLAYCDGSCAGQPTSIPSTRYIISSLAGNCGIIGDCQPGNPAPAVWVGWVGQRRAAGEDPTIYCADDSLSSFFNGYKWSEVRAAFQSAGVAQPHYWIAKPSASAIPAGAVAVQTATVGSYDISLVADYWPGVDSFQPPVVGGEEDSVVTAQWNGQLHVLWVDASGNLQHRWQGPGGNPGAPWGSEVLGVGFAPSSFLAADASFAGQAHVFVDSAGSVTHFFQGSDGVWRSEQP